MKDFLVKLGPALANLGKAGSPYLAYLGGLGLVILGSYQLYLNDAPEAAGRNVLIGLGLLGVPVAAPPATPTKESK